MSSSGKDLRQSLANPIERRERRPVHLPGHIVQASGVTTEVAVVDLSYDGCGIECPVELTPGEKIRLGVVRRGAIIADVRWYQDGKAGLVFEPEPQASTGPLPRQSERITVTAEVLVRRQGRQGFRVRVFDASMHGCKLELVEMPQIDDPLWIRFDGLTPLEARVCWLDDRSAGLEFSRPIHPAVFDLIAERLRQGS